MNSATALQSTMGKPLDDEEAFQRALRELDAEIPDVVTGQGDDDAGTPAPSPRLQAETPSKSILQRGVDLWKSAGAGIAKAGFETKDFIFGEPEEDQKSNLRRGIEQRGRELARESTANALTMGISQMVTGLVGAGKIMAPIKGAKWMMEGGKTAKAGFEIAKASAASAVVLDPHEERLSNLVEQFPALQNPVTDYLAASPEDSAAEGRFKNALESIGVDFALVGVVKAIKYLRAGNNEAAQSEIAKLSKTEKPKRPNFREEFGPKKPNPPQPRETTTEARTESPVLDGTTTPGKGETPLSESPRVEEQRVEFEERAAILEHDAGFPRAEAERRAAIETGYQPKTDDLIPSTAAAELPLGQSPHGKLMEVTDDQVSAILKSTEADLAAIKQYGSREAAAEAGQMVTRAESSLPWQKLRSSEEVAAFMGNAARVLKNQMDEAKGGAVMSDAKVNAMVEARAALFGEDPALVLGQIKEAGQSAKGMFADMEAGYLIGSRMMEDTYSMAFRMENGMEADMVKAGQELKARLGAAADLMANARSISSNSGRALRRMRGQFRFAPELMEKVKAMDGAELARLLYQTKGDLKKMAQVVNPTFLSRLLNEATFSLTNSLLWLWPTGLLPVSWTPR